MIAVLEYRLRVWRRTFGTNLVLDFVLPLLLLSSMGLGLGGLVDSHAHSSGGVDNLPYLMFIAPGVLASTALQTSFGESGYPIVAGLRWYRHFEAMAATSLRPAAIVRGLLAFVATKLGVTCTAFLIVAAVLGATSGWSAVLAVPAAILTGLAFAAPVMALTAFAPDDNGGQLALLERLVVVPMTLFAGTFFPITALPLVLQWVAKATPLWHGVELCRGFTTDRVHWSACAGHVGYLLVWLILGVIAASVIMRRRLSA